MQGLDREISERYGLDIKNIAPFKDSFIINTNKGRKVLKKSTFSTDKINFIHGAKEHLYKNNFKNLDRYLCTFEGKPYITVDGHNYTITDIIEGTECNFDRREDTINAARALALLHKASEGYISPENSTARNDLGKLPMYFSKRLDEIKKLKKIAKKGKSNFDYLFLEWVDYFYDIGEKTLDSLNNSNYHDLAESTRQKGIFCHHDYTHHNIIFSDGNVSVINFEFCCYELRVYDIANLLRRKMRKCNWDIKEAKVITDAYRTVSNIGNDEFYITKLMLQFPQKLWRVVNKFYNSKRSWSEKNYTNKLLEVIDETEYLKRFIEEFDSII